GRRRGHIGRRGYITGVARPAAAARGKRGGRNSQGANRQQTGNTHPAILSRARPSRRAHGSSLAGTSPSDLRQNRRMHGRLPRLALMTAVTTALLAGAPVTHALQPLTADVLIQKNIDARGGLEKM